MAFTDFVTTIQRHSVPSNSEKLSPLQSLAIDSPSKIRIFSAPTGAGKSYAFRRAMTDQQKRVLFIVPTRRLAQNLFASLKQEIVEAGVAKNIDDASKYASLWISDESEAIKAQNPSADVAKIRMLEVFDYHNNKGRMIVATPESVSWRILPSFRKDDLATFGISDFVENFDHIVFDEFHTIDPRGFGLAATLCGFAAKLPNCPLQATFLSATPIDIAPVLEKLGIPNDQIEIANETIITGAELLPNARAIHGDVTLNFTEAETLCALAEANVTAIKASLAANQQVLFVFDSRQTLFAQKQRLSKFLATLHLTKRDILAINSTDDSAKDDGDDLFSQGARHNPEKFKVIIATSSIEMGVTFRTNLMFTDPGHDMLSLVQRIGRVARGDIAGAVFIRISEASIDRNADLRHFIDGLQNGPEIDILTFMRLAMDSAAKRFEIKTPSANASDTFRALPERAIWASALYWHALRHQAWPGIAKTISEFQPHQAAVISAKLHTIEITNHSGKAWAVAFRKEAKILRNIGETFECRLDGDRVGFIPQRDRIRFPSLASAPVYFEGENAIIELDRPLYEIYGQQKLPHRDSMIEALFPHRSGTMTIREADPVSSWLQTANAASNRIPTKIAKALKEASDLVRMTQIIPLILQNTADGNTIL